MVAQREAYSKLSRMLFAPLPRFAVAYLSVLAEVADYAVRTVYPKFLEIKPSHTVALRNVYVTNLEQGTIDRREILPLPNGTLVVDTPGMREFHLWLADTGLDESFPELREFAQGCRFRDCTHGAEPDCAVKNAVEKGKLPRDRYESYRKLHLELDSTAQRQREHDYSQNKHRARAGTKVYLKTGRQPPGESS